jgi:hypothetical protein
LEATGKVHIASTLRTCTDRRPPSVTQEATNKALYTCPSKAAGTDTTGTYRDRERAPKGKALKATIIEMAPFVHGRRPEGASRKMTI